MTLGGPLDFHLNSLFYSGESLEIFPFSPILLVSQREHPAWPKVSGWALGSDLGLSMGMV